MLWLGVVLGESVSSRTASIDSGGMVSVMLVWLLPIFRRERLREGSKIVKGRYLRPWVWP